MSRPRALPADDLRTGADDAHLGGAAGAELADHGQGGSADPSSVATCSSFDHAVIEHPVRAADQGPPLGVVSPPAP